jgi:transcriptional regulator with XRE-family HTH domain
MFVSSAETLQMRIKRRLEELQLSLSELAKDAGMRASRFCHLLRGEPKSMRLTTLDDLAVVLRTAPWLLLQDDVGFEEFEQKEFDSSDAFLRNVDFEYLNKQTRWDIRSKRRTTFTLKKLDKIAKLMGVTTAELITPR